LIFECIIALAYISPPRQSYRYSRIASIDPTLWTHYITNSSGETVSLPNCENNKTHIACINTAYCVSRI